MELFPYEDDDFEVFRTMTGKLRIVHRRTGAKETATAAEVDHLNGALDILRKRARAPLTKSQAADTVNLWAEAIVTGRSSALWQGVFLQDPAKMCDGAGLDGGQVTQSSGGDHAPRSHLIGNPSVPEVLSISSRSSALLPSTVTFAIALICIVLGAVGAWVGWVLVTGTVNWAIYVSSRPGMDKVMAEERKHGSIIKLHAFGVLANVAVNGLFFVFGWVLGGLIG